MVKKCVACLEKETKSNNCTFHRFPTGKSLQKTWVKLLSPLDLNNVSHQRVYSNHFDSSAFITYTSNQKNNITSQKRLKRLKRDALPINIVKSAQTTSGLIFVSTQTGLYSNDLSDLFDKISLYKQTIFKTTIWFERFRHDNINIRYYTGFRSYDIFMMVYELLQ
ncbi:unnamed protein product, partial [Rotaria sp. Silwood2]